MKHNKKRLLAALTAGFLTITPAMLSGMMTATASTLTIDNATDDSSEHIYTAYQIITGTKSGNTLSDMNWGTGVDSDALVAALKTFDVPTFGSLPASGATATAVAELLDGYQDVEGLAKVFNGANILTNVSDDITYNSTSGKYVSGTLADGWYFVKDTIDITQKTNDTTNVRSANLLQIVGDTVVTPKFSLPTLDKRIEGPNQNTAKNANSASIGETITYTINLKVPDTTGYNKYFYVVEDTLSAGLTYIGTTSVSIDGNPITLDTTPSSSDRGTYNINVGTYNETTGTSIKYVFEDFLGYIQNTDGVDVGDEIVITYTAKLNGNAKTDSGNPNDARLIYSNDPNHTYTGKTDTNPDEPNTGEPIGETPYDTVTTYTTEVQIKKVDQDGKPLTGASFTLKGSSVYTVYTAGVTFAEDTNGSYWKLANDSYTTTDPEDSDSALYDSTTKKYSKTVNTGTPQDATGTGTEKSITATVDNNGYISFKGLGAGTYTLTESTTPDGYNTISPITFTISNGSNMSDSIPDWSIDNNSFTRVAAENMYEIEIENAQGSTLPTTGGIGTKLFYIFGGLLVTGSVVILVTKKRMSGREN